MPIRVLIDGGPAAHVVLDSIKEDPRGFFWVYSRENESVGLAVPYPYGNRPQYNCAETEVLLLLNPFHVEAAVMEVTLQPGTKRLGYVFPAVSAGSRNHRYSENNYFRTACFAGVFKTLERFVVKTTSVIELGSRSASCSIDDLFDGELVILAVHLPYAANAGISLEQLGADLHRHGYVFANSPCESGPRRLAVVKANFESAYNAGRLAMRPLAAHLAFDPLIGKFLGQRITCPDDPVLRFFYLYQIIERVLELELRSNSKKLLAALAAVDPSGTKIVGAFQELKDAFSEKTRLRTLFEVRASGALKTSPTIAHFTAFLRGCEVDEEESYWANFYKVRNVLFHAWWSIPSELNAEFEEIVAGIENDIPELILNYGFNTDHQDNQHMGGDYSI